MLVYLKYMCVCFNCIRYKYHYLGLDARKPVFVFCEHKRCKPACVSAQSDQRLYYSIFGEPHISTCYKHYFNLLASRCSLSCFLVKRRRKPRRQVFPRRILIILILIIFGVSDKDSNLSSQLQRLSRKLEFHLWQVYIRFVSKR